MKYAGNQTARTKMTVNGFREDGGPADIKKTFLYNQKLTSEVFQILEDHPDRQNEQK